MDADADAEQVSRSEILRRLIVREYGDRVVSAA